MVSSPANEPWTTPQCKNIDSVVWDYEQYSVLYRAEDVENTYLEGKQSNFAVNE